MWKIITLSTFQALLLSGGQILLKIAMERLPKFSFSFNYLHDLLTNWWLLAMGLCFGGAGILWAFLIKNYPLSIVYPLSSIAYVFGMIAAVWLFKESIPLLHWLGVLLIMSGVFLIAR